MALFKGCVYTGRESLQGAIVKLGFLAIGTELLQGKIQEANGFWLAQFLRPWSLRLENQLSVGDSPAEIKRGMDFLYQTCDLIICSGGLGPTPDDITKTVLADYFGKTVKPSAEARACAEKNYSRFDRSLPAEHGYGFLPEGFVPLDNPSGFAPGLFFATSTHQLLAAPGVPKEFRDMLTAHFATLLTKKLVTLPRVELLSFRSRGIPEEKIFKELCPGLWEQLAVHGAVSSLPHPMGVDVGVVTSGDPEIVRQIVRASALWPHVWHEGFSSLEEVLVKEAEQRSITIGLAESCTGGLCAHRLTNVPGSSRVFWGGVVSYDNSIKESALGVESETLARWGAVSEQTALQMATGARARLKTTYTLSLTGIAGPGGGSEEKPVGTLWTAVSGPTGTTARKHHFKGDREALKFRFSQAGLFALLDAVRNH